MVIANGNCVNIFLFFDISELNIAILHVIPLWSPTNYSLSLPTTSVLVRITLMLWIPDTEELTLKLRYTTRGNMHKTGVGFA